MLYDNKVQLLLFCCPLLPWYLVSSAMVFPSESSVDMDSSNSGGAEGERRERLRKKTSAEEEATMAGKGRAEPCPAQEAAEGEDCWVPTGGAREVGDSAVPSNIHPTLPRLPG